MFVLTSDKKYGSITLSKMQNRTKGTLQMSNKIILCADSTCDLSPELCERYNVVINSFTVILDEKTYHDGVDLTPDDMYRVYREKKILPHTSATNIDEYEAMFRKYIDQGCDVIFINLGSGLSATYNNCRLAAESFPGRAFAVDSRNLSTGTGLLVIEAAKMIEEGKLTAAEIVERLCEIRNRVHASFVIDTLEFLYKGGRCSALAMFGANALKLRPCIMVDNQSGKMSVGKKYRGNMDKVVLQYAKDAISGIDIDTEKVFITHSGVPESQSEAVRALLAESLPFENIYITRAGCGISTHCGPGTLGVLFIAKK